MDLLYAFIFMLLGIAWGVVLNWFADCVDTRSGTRWFAGYIVGEIDEAVFEPRRPRCAKCGIPRPWLHLLPFAAYFAAQGRCAACGERIPARIPIVEFVTGALFAALFLSFKLSPELWILLVYTSLLIVLFVTDLEHFILPNIVTYPGMLLAALIALLVTLFHYRLSWAVFFAGSDFMSLFNNFLLSAVAGGLAGALLLFLVAVASRGGMGWGDVVLAGLLGLMAGFPMVFVALFTGVITGGMVAAVLLISGRKKRREMLPFGPFLCLGGLVTLLWGRQILGWYLSFI